MMLTKGLTIKFTRHKGLGCTFDVSCLLVVFLWDPFSVFHLNQLLFPPGNILSSGPYSGSMSICRCRLGVISGHAEVRSCRIFFSLSFFSAST